MSFTLLWRVGSVLNLPLAGFIKKLKARYCLFTLHHQQENWSSTMLGSVFLYPKFIHSFNALHDIVRGRSFMVWPMAQNNTRRGWVSKKILRMLYFVSFYYLQVKKNKDFLGHRICTSQPKHLRSHHTIIPAGLHSQPLFLCNQLILAWGLSLSDRSLEENAITFSNFQDQSHPSYLEWGGSLGFNEC